MKAIEKLAEIFGWKPGAWSSLRDGALTTVAWIATMWAIGALIPKPDSDFDRNLGLVSLAIAIACCLASPNSRVIVGGVAGITIVQGLFGYTVTGDDRVLLVIVPAAAILYAVVRFSGNWRRR